MMDKMKISVIIPTYNNVALFERAVESVLCQTLKPHEIIVTDDSSTDEVERLCKTIGSPLIKYNHNKPGLGAVKNWNNGLSKATGDWIIVLHHDEEFSTTDYLENYPGIWTGTML